MNATEAAYAQRLGILQRAGDVQSFRFEPVKFRLADRTWFSPDFLVVDVEGFVEFHEVKAMWRGKVGIEDDAAVKIKVAAEMYPEFRFLLAARKPGGTGWEFVRYWR